MNFISLLKNEKVFTTIIIIISVYFAINQMNPIFIGVILIFSGTILFFYNKKSKYKYVLILLIISTFLLMFLWLIKLDYFINKIELIVYYLIIISSIQLFMENISKSQA